MTWQRKLEKKEKREGNTQEKKGKWNKGGQRRENEGRKEGKKGGGKKEGRKKRS